MYSSWKHRIDNVEKVKAPINLTDTVGFLSKSSSLFYFSNSR